MKIQYLIDAYNALMLVYRDKAFISQAIKSVPESEYKKTAVRLIYGVVERDYEAEVIIDSLTWHKPKTSVRVLLKMGIYCLKYMDSMPNHAVVNNIVELSKKVGKTANSGFINAVLKKVSAKDYKIPTDSVKFLAYESSTPVWLVNKLIDKFGKEEAEKLLLYKHEVREHIRINSLYKSDEDKIIETLKLKPSGYGGFYMNSKDYAAGRTCFDSGKITYQAEGSMLIAKLVAENKRKKILDLCAAPGGKAIYISELTGSEVLACDIHKHRLELIEAYCRRMKNDKVLPVQLDAVQLHEKFAGLFDSVLVDAPCSGTGVRYSKPDILINLDSRDIASLTRLQSAILTNAAQYVKRGGTLVYSTCSILDEENMDIVTEFMKLGGYEIDMPDGKPIELLPHRDKAEGFFAVRLRKL